MPFHVRLHPASTVHGQAILTRNFDVLQRKGGQKKSALTNIVMELKKCANHPWLIEGAPGALDPQLDAEQLQELVDSCGKMQLLHQMLPKLQRGGHRVLIFSQVARTDRVTRTKRT